MNSQVQNGSQAPLMYAQPSYMPPEVSYQAPTFAPSVAPRVQKPVHQQAPYYIHPTMQGEDQKLQQQMMMQQQPQQQSDAQMMNYQTWLAQQQLMQKQQSGAMQSDPVFNHVRVEEPTPNQLYRYQQNDQDRASQMSNGSKGSKAVLNLNTQDIPGAQPKQTLKVKGLRRGGFFPEHPMIEQLLTKDKPYGGGPGGQYRRLAPYGVQPQELTTDMAGNPLPKLKQNQDSFTRQGQFDHLYNKRFDFGKHVAENMGQYNQSAPLMVRNSEQYNHQAGISSKLEPSPSADLYQKQVRDRRDNSSEHKHPIGGHNFKNASSNDHQFTYQREIPLNLKDNYKTESAKINYPQIQPGQLPTLSNSVKIGRYTNNVEFKRGLEKYGNQIMSNPQNLLMANNMSSLPTPQNPGQPARKSEVPTPLTADMRAYMERRLIENQTFKQQHNGARPALPDWSGVNPTSHPRHPGSSPLLI